MGLIQFCTFTYQFYIKKIFLEYCEFCFAEVILFVIVCDNYKNAEEEFNEKENSHIQRLDLCSVLTKLEVCQLWFRTY